MFGIGSKGKEIELTAVIAPAIETLEGVQVAKLPDYLQNRFKDFSLLAEEYDALRSIRRERRMPGTQKDVYDTRIAHLDDQLKGMGRIAKVIHLGYEPFTVSKEYYIGGVEDEIGGWRFNAPLPPGILTRYEEAREAGVFDRIAVASPNPDHFLHVSSIRIDPLMVGYVRTSERTAVSFAFRSRFSKDEPGNWGQESGFPGPKISGGVGFLIAHWNLAEDLQALKP